MAANILPLDDLELEMEEVEGLVELSPVGRGRRSKPSSQSTSIVVGTVAGVCSSRYRSRWLCLILILAAVLTTLWLTNRESVEVAEGTGGSQVSDVEGKNATSAAHVTPRPTPKAEPKPTEAAKAQPKPTETPKPELKPTETPKLEPKPTEAAKVEPKPTEDSNKTEPKPTEKPAPATSSANTAEKDKTAESTLVPQPDKETKPTDQPPSDKPPKTAVSSDEPSTGYAWPETPFAVRTENPPSQAILDEYAKTWGTWQLGELPEMDRNAFCGDYSHCDVPREKFPSDAWQSDSNYLAKFLDEADKLVVRAMNAILAEYGKTADDAAMFNLTYRDLKRRQLKGPPDNGGWTTKRSMQGLSRRLLHAIMTRDTFTFVMGGHSAAAGHGNHFKQSYAMQFHKVMEPVFSYLGVQLISRNLAQGGLGTVQSSLGAADIYGDEIDFMIWDSGMTEARDGKAVDMYGRQSLMAHRVPVLWNLNPDLLELYHEHCDADVGLLGTGEVGIPETKDDAHAATLPYAIQYYACDGEHSQMCRDHKYNANCWVDRPDVTPPTTQEDHPGSQVSWHPGFRWHQLTGRILAYTVLAGLKEAINTWKQAEGNVLADEAWHVTPYYDNIRNKVMNLTATLGQCNQYKDQIPVRMCNTQLRGRTEFTPRANPEKTSIRSILKTGDYTPSIEDDILYGGSDVRNPMFDIPDGEVDVLAILNNGRKFPGDQVSRRLSGVETPSAAERRVADEILPGKGYELVNHPAGYCDGSYNAVCSRSKDSKCLLYGHHDSRNGLFFNEYSGWIVMEIPKVKHGIIVIKMETWHWPEDITITKDWTTVNNERYLRDRQSSINEQQANDCDGVSGRHLKRQPPEYCDDFKFDFAIDGKITTYNKDEFQKSNKPIQRVVEVVTLLDDPTYVNKGEEKDIEVAIRIRGCGKIKTFSLTHVYWA